MHMASSNHLQPRPEVVYQDNKNISINEPYKAWMILLVGERTVITRIDDGSERVVTIYRFAVVQSCNCDASATEERSGTGYMKNGRPRRFGYSAGVFVPEYTK